MNITEQIIETLKSSRGGWSKKHLAEMGQPWPPPKHWKRYLIDYDKLKDRQDLIDKYLLLGG